MFSPSLLLTVVILLASAARAAPPEDSKEGKTSPSVPELIRLLSDDAKWKDAAKKLKAAGKKVRKPLQDALRKVRGKATIDERKVAARLREILLAVAPVRLRLVATGNDVTLEGVPHQKQWKGPLRRLLVIRDAKTLANYKVVKDAVAGTKIDFGKQMVVVVAGRYRGECKVGSALLFDAGDELTVAYRLEMTPFSGRGDRPPYWSVLVTAADKRPVRFIETKKETWALVPSKPKATVPIDRGRLAPKDPELTIGQG